MNFKVRIEQILGKHHEVTVFSGPDSEHMARLGVLVMLEEESQEFIRRLEDPNPCGPDCYEVIKELQDKVEELTTRLNNARGANEVLRSGYLKLVEENALLKKE